MHRVITRRSDDSNKDINEEFASGPRRSNGMFGFAGTWSAEEHRQIRGEHCIPRRNRR
jgi:hypothetical protein